MQRIAMQCLYRSLEHKEAAINGFCTILMNYEDFLYQRNLKKPLCFPARFINDEYHHCPLG